jgi:hypothetical protein
MTREFPQKRDMVLSAIVWAPLLAPFIHVFRKLTWGSLVICGPIKGSNLFESTHSISQSRRVLSSPSLSFDRLKIEHGKFGDYILISPFEKRVFLRHYENAVRI